MVTHQLQVERRTGKVRRPETDVLPLSHASAATLFTGVRACVRACIDELLHMLALLRFNRLLLVFPLAALFDYLESRAHRKVVYYRYIPVDIT